MDHKVQLNNDIILAPSLLAFPQVKGAIFFVLRRILANCVVRAADTNSHVPEYASTLYQQPFLAFHSASYAKLVLLLGRPEALRCQVGWCWAEVLPCQPWEPSALRWKAVVEQKLG